MDRIMGLIAMFLLALAFGTAGALDATDAGETQTFLVASLPDDLQAPYQQQHEDIQAPYDGGDIQAPTQSDDVQAPVRDV